MVLSSIVLHTMIKGGKRTSHNTWCFHDDRNAFEGGKKRNMFKWIDACSFVLLAFIYTTQNLDTPTNWESFSSCSSVKSR